MNTSTEAWKSAVFFLMPRIFYKLKVGLELLSRSENLA